MKGLNDEVKISGQFRVFLLMVTTVVLLLGSLWIWIYVFQSVEEQRKAEFNRVVETTKEEVINSLFLVVERLYDLRGFITSGGVDLEKWNSYLLATGVDNRQPGIYTFGYAPRVEKKELESFLEKIRREEKSPMYENFSVYPVADNADYFPIQYIFTRDEDLKSFLGYDLGSSTTQTAAIKQAVFEDTSVITDLLSVGMVIPGNEKVGYEVMLPVYSREDIGELPMDERNKYFVGLVGTWIFPESLIPMAEKEEILRLGNIKVTVFDGDREMFLVGNEKVREAEVVDSHEVILLNKKFRFEFAAAKSMILSPFTERLPLLTGIGLIIVNLMWMTTIYSVLIARRRALHLAEEATGDLVKFKQAVEGVSDQVIITDIDGVMIYVNGATEKASGYKKEDLVGKKIEFLHESTNDFSKKVWKTIKENKKPFWGETLNKRKNGEVYEAEVEVSPIFDEAGELIYFVGVERDLTRMRAMEKMKREFLSLASHQLRTPLSAVKWFGKMLLSGEAGKLNPDQKGYVEKIYESNEREIDLVNSLLNVSRIESGKIVVVPRQTDLKTMVETVVIDLRQEADKGRKKITLVLDRKIPEMMIDGDLIRHAYSNLILNAIRYTKTGGKILVKVYLDKNKVMSEVKDNGIGIPRVEQKRVFEKFFRAANALKKVTDGNGLGLYLSKTIIESSGGKIGFKSVENKGSTFWFSLPVKSQERK
ncbi:MAG TPA: ATP-binding protein [Candidatus Woesebacteria bacterium]|nr:ATP-binding protein [Candidatus Woesebacteria bacterium]